jgi:hypothetical protein
LEFLAGAVPETGSRPQTGPLNSAKMGPANVVANVMAAVKVSAHDVERTSRAFCWRVGANGLQRLPWPVGPGMIERHAGGNRPGQIIMKLIKWLVVLLLVAAVIAVVVMHEDRNGAKRVAAEARDAAQSVKSAVTDAVGVSTKAMSEAATNVAATVKQTTTNVVGDVKQKMDSPSH